MRMRQENEDAISRAARLRKEARETGKEFKEADLYPVEEKILTPEKDIHSEVLPKKMKALRKERKVLRKGRKNGR